MTDYTIAIYCFLDDFLQKTTPMLDKRRKLNDAQLMTPAVMAARFFHGNLAADLVL